MDFLFNFLTSWIPIFAIYGILSISLNLEIGYTGMANFGKVAFYAIGAYLSAALTMSVMLSLVGKNVPLYSIEAVEAVSNPSTGAIYTHPWAYVGLFVLSLVLAFVVAGVVGYLITYPTLRVGPAFLGITVLAFGEMFRVFMRNYEPLGSTKGLFGLNNPFIWIGNPQLAQAIFALIALGLLLATYVYAERFVNSPLGRTLRAIKDDEVAALCLGKHVPRVKATVFFIASGMAGVAGVLWTFYQGSVQPDTFVPILTFYVWAMVILGGIGNNLGALIGAAVFTLVDRALTFAAGMMGPSMLIPPNYLRWMIVGIVIVFVLLFRPEGIKPAKPIKTPAWEAVKEEVGEGG